MTAKLTRRGRLLVLGALVAGAAVLIWFAVRGPALDIPDDPCAQAPPLVTRRGVTLQPVAMRAFREAQRIAGRRIPVVQSYRSCLQQAEACRRVCGNARGCPGLCAPPGLSWHQLGAAIDIRESALRAPRVVAALEEAGWCQAVPDTDPGHFSFGGCH